MFSNIAGSCRDECYRVLPLHPFRLEWDFPARCRKSASASTQRTASSLPLAGFQKDLLIFGVLHIFIRGFPEISHCKFELLWLDFAIFPESIANFLQHPAFLRHLFQMNRNVVIIVKAESFHPVSYLHTSSSSCMNCS